MEKELYGYMIDSDGFVWNKAHTQPLKYELDKSGYKRVCISNHNKKKMMFVHRLVAEAFCEKPPGCDIVNHIDSNRLNCNYTNLEWTTVKGNIEHAIKYGSFGDVIYKWSRANCIPLAVYKDGNKIQEFSSITELCKYYDANINTISYYIDTDKTYQGLVIQKIK